ncbi:MAG: hypothetical protein R6U55_01130 [Desulfovermiculus sp.]
MFSFKRRGILSELGFNHLVVDKILNHKDRTMTGTHTMERNARHWSTGSRAGTDPGREGGQGGQGD